MTNNNRLKKENNNMGPSNHGKSTGDYLHTTTKNQRNQHDGDGIDQIGSNEELHQ